MRGSRAWICWTRLRQNKCTKQDCSGACQDQDLASRFWGRLRLESSAPSLENRRYPSPLRNAHNRLRDCAKNCTCPWSELCGAAEKCETEVANTLQHFVGRTISSNVVTQAGLLGPLGGIVLRLTSSCADAHHVARTHATTKLVKEALGTNQEFVNEAFAEMASERLTDNGVKVSADGADGEQWPGELTTPPTQGYQRCGAHTHPP